MSDARNLDGAAARVAAAPADAGAPHARGGLLLEGGAAEDLPRAIEALRAAVALDDRRADCRAALGCALDRAGDVVPGAANACYAATRLAPDEALYEAFHAALLAGEAPPDVAQAAVERACKHQGIDLRQIRSDLERAGARPTPAALAARAFGDVRLRMADRLREEAARP
jgi:Flp pilus assembly protein TadD